MPLVELRMTLAQMAALVDAAIRCPRPVAFFDAAVLTFRMIGRSHDSIATAWMGCLYAEGEIDALLSLRVAWRRGEDRSPVEAATNLLRLVPCADGDRWDRTC